MFAVAFNFTKNDIEFLSIKTLSKRLLANHVDFLPIKITSIKVSRNNVDFSIREIISKKYLEKMSIFRTWKLNWKKYVAKTWIFRPVKLRQKNTWRQGEFFDQQNYVEKVPENDVEILRNLVSNVSTEYRHRIDVSSMWCARWNFD